MVGLQGQGNKLITELSAACSSASGSRGHSLRSRRYCSWTSRSRRSTLDPARHAEPLLDIQGEVNRTVVFVTHDLDEALRLGHRVAIMKDGEIVQLGTPEQILREPANEYVDVSSRTWTTRRCAWPRA